MRADTRRRLVLSKKRPGLPAQLPSRRVHRTLKMPVGEVSTACPAAQPPTPLSSFLFFEYVWSGLSSSVYHVLGEVSTVCIIYVCIYIYIYVLKILRILINSKEVAGRQTVDTSLRT